MKNFSETLDELVKKKMQIEQWKAAHPEAVEIVQMVEDYLKLFDDFYRQCQPPTVIAPYPSSPVTTNPVIINPAPITGPRFPLDPPYKITCATGCDE
jgi:hypothetical protein